MGSPRDVVCQSTFFTSEGSNTRSWAASPVYPFWNARSMQTRQLASPPSRRCCFSQAKSQHTHDVRYDGSGSTIVSDVDRLHTAVAVIGVGKEVLVVVGFHGLVGHGPIVLVEALDDLIRGVRGAEALLFGGTAGGARRMDGGVEW